MGVYSSKYLTDEGLWDQIKPKVVPVQDVRATLASVESGNVEAGFVYKTDAAISKKVKIVYEVPIDKGPKSHLSHLPSSKSKKRRRPRFHELCFESGSQGHFQKYGFVVLD